MNNASITPKIIVLWSTPRSVSTAFEKTFSQRSDTNIVHEPFTNCYYFSHKRVSNRYGDYSFLENYVGEVAIDAIQSQNSKPITFVKDLAFQAFYYLSDDFFNQIDNTFLMRSPQEVIASLYKLKPDFTDEEFGFYALYDLFKRKINMGEDKPIVVDATRFRNNPEEQLQKYCQLLNIQFYSEMLTWQAAPLKKWEEHERDSQKKWHEQLESSTKINQPKRQLQVEIKPEHQDLVARCCDIYQEMLAYAI